MADYGQGLKAALGLKGDPLYIAIWLIVAHLQVWLYKGNIYSDIKDGSKQYYESY